MVCRVEALPRRRVPSDNRARRLLGLLGVSVLLHVPLTPLGALLGLLGLLGDPSLGKPPPDLGDVLGIPVDLLDEGRPEAPAPVSTPAPAPLEDVDDAFDDLDDDEPEPASVVPDRPPAAPDAGIEAADAGAPAMDAQAPGDAGAGPHDAGKGQGIRDPVAVLGAAASVADANAHVRLILHNDRIRKHDLGKRVGHLLAMAPQWRTFFGPAALDPVQDVDRMLIAGPQLRDSSNVVVVIQHRAGRERIRTAIDALMSRRTPPGQWVDVNGIAVAEAFADRAERTFLVPSRDVVVLVPPSARASALSQVKKGMRLPPQKGDEVLSAFIRTPTNALRGLFPVPESIRWVRLDVTPTEDGGATARIEAEDESPESAKRHADELTRAINALTQVRLGAVGALFGKREHRIIEPVTFAASGVRIEATLRATPKQFRLLLEQVAALTEQLAREAQGSAPREPEAPASAAPPLASGAAPALPAPTGPAEPALPPAPTVPPPASPGVSPPPTPAPSG